MALNDVTKHTASRRRFVLVVDSDETRLSYVSALLERFHYQVCTARTAREALEVAAIITPILVVTARQLADMPGLALIKKLKQIEATASVSIIVLGSEADAALDRACLAAGAVVCLSTPFLIEDFYRVIQMTVEPVPRMNLRISTRLPITIHDKLVDCEEGGCARALSEQGAYIRTRQPYPLKTRLPVRIDLGDAELSVQAEVIYAHKNRPGIGLQFVQISQEDQLRIRKYIRAEITRGIR